MNAAGSNPDTAPIAPIETLARAGQFREAAELVAEHVTRLGKTPYLLFCQGRNARHLGRLTEAAESLRAALAAAPDFAEARLELAAVYLLSAEFPAAGHEALRFAESLTEATAATLTAADRDVLRKAGHGSYDADRAATVRLYQRLDALNLADYLTRLRLAESLADAHDMKAAEAALQRLDGDKTLAPAGLDPWGKLVRVRVLRALGATNAARDLAAAVLADSPPGAGVRVLACHRLLDLGMVERVRPVVAELSRLPEAQLTQPMRELRLRHACLAGGAELAALHGWIDATDAALSAFPDGVLVDAVFTLSRPGADETERAAVAGRIVADLATRTRSQGVVLACLHHYQARGLYAEAERLLAAIAGEAFADHPEIRFRRFELACRMREFGLAAEIYDAELRDRRLASWEAALVLRFLLEADRAAEAVALLEDRIDANEELPRDDALLMQVIRQGDAHARLLARLTVASPRGEAAHAEMIRRVVDDLCLARGAAFFDDGGVAREISPANRWLVGGHGPRIRELATGAAFLCSDRAYFFAALVFLLSVGARSPQSAAGLDWFVFLDPAIPPGWHDALARVAAFTGLVLHGVSGAEFLPETRAGRAEYGIFTGGLALSAAAYYRLYAAAYLARAQTYGFGCYFDCDLICRAELSGLLMAPFGGHALLARAETASEDTRLAAARCGVAQAAYFNSGVLKWDFRATEFPGGLERAREVAEHAPERLTFHDQCALNIGFAGHVGTLAPELNHFLRPQRQETAQGAERAVLIHYLDRPKPWDTGFSLPTRRFFEPHARELRALLPSALFGEMVAAAVGLDRDQIRA